MTQVSTCARARNDHSATDTYPTKTPRSKLVRLRVRADHCPQVLLRVLGLIAQQAVIPVTIAAERRTRELRFEIELDGLPDQSAKVLLAKVEAIVAVRSARIASRQRQS